MALNVTNLTCTTLTVGGSGLSAPTFSLEGNTATDGAGAAFNESTIPLTISGSNTLLIAFWHAEFGDGAAEKYLWLASFNGIPGNLFVIEDGYHGGAGNTLFRGYYWTAPAAGTNNLVIKLVDGAGATSAIPNELSVSTVLLNGASQTFFPFRDIDSDVDATTNRTSETETVDSETSDLICHVIADVLVSRGTLGAGETSRSIANDGTDDASLWFATKDGAATSTTVSSSGWANSFPLGGVAFSVMAAGTAETYSVAEDNFTRANENPISNGGMWSSPVGSGTTAVAIVSNQAKGTTGGENMARIATPVFPADQRARITYVGAQFGGPCVRIQGSSDASCYMLSSNGVNAVQIYKVTDTGGSLSYSQLGADFTVSGVRGLIAGDYLELEATGTSTTTLSFYWNGMLFGSRTDASSPFTSGQPGMRVFGADASASAFQASSLPVRYP